MAFDLAVTKRDPKTGKVIEVNDYVMTVDARGTRFERPPGSGMFFDGDGKLLKIQEPVQLEAVKPVEAVKAVEPAKPVPKVEEKKK